MKMDGLWGKIIHESMVLGKKIHENLDDEFFDMDNPNLEMDDDLGVPKDWYGNLHLVGKRHWTIMESHHSFFLGATWRSI